jgi:protein-S-isoprenylcysteine O-methyltransferase Ste14
MIQQTLKATILERAHDGGGMALYEEFQTQGNWLFRWRSYLPFPLIVLAFDSLSMHEIWEEVCLTISAAGLFVRVITVGFAPAHTSGRNTKCQEAGSLNTMGIYSVVRHPLYLGNFLIGLGISLVLWVWWLPAIYTLLFCVYYERIMFAEEQFLRRRFGQQFESWAATTPAFWPRFAHWRRSSLPFSLRTVLRREYTGLLVVIAGHAGVEFAEQWILPRTYHHDKFWDVLFASGIVLYFLLRTLKKRTHVLDVPGR